MTRTTLISQVLLLASLLVVGCGQADRGEVDLSDDPPMLRIVSLSPAISRTLIDLELDEYLVGRTPFCDAVDRSISVVGDLLDLNMELLVRVRPTHVLLQPPAGGINPALVRLANERGWAIGAWHLDTIDDVRVMIGELPDVISDGDLLDDEQHLVLRAAELLQQIDDSLKEDADAFRGPALLVFGLEPVTVFGEGTYLDEVLTALGGRNVITHRGYPQFSLEDIARMKPEAVILVAPRAANEQSPRERLGAIARLDIPAVRNERLAVLDHPDGLLPSSGIIGVAQAMRELLTAMRESSVDEASRRGTEAQSENRNGTTGAQSHGEHAVKRSAGGP
jgi:ABC-type hemin transport system substrate-binding protein